MKRSGNAGSGPPLPDPGEMTDRPNALLLCTIDVDSMQDSLYRLSHKLVQRTDKRSGGSVKAESGTG